MRFLRTVAIISVISISAVTSADVVDSADHGFSIKHKSTVKATPKVVYETLLMPALWWNPSHSWSGDSQNLSIDPTPGGGFLEKLPDGGFVKHMDVVYAAPGKLLRMHGSLGPLQEQAVHGSMTIKLAGDGEQTTLEVSYNVSGYVAGGMKNWAAPVNQVLTEQFTRLKAKIETGE